MAVGVHKPGINVQPGGFHNFFVSGGQALADGGNFAVPDQDIRLIRRFVNRVVYATVLNQHGYLSFIRKMLLIIPRRGPEVKQNCVWKKVML